MKRKETRGENTKRASGKSIATQGENTTASGKRKVTKSSDGLNNTFCKQCKKLLQVQKLSLLQHEKSREHQFMIELVPKTSASSMARFVQRTVKMPEKTKEVEVKLAVTITCHCSILAINHLSEVIKGLGTGSCLTHLSSLHQVHQPAQESHWPLLCG